MRAEESGGYSLVFDLEPRGGHAGSNVESWSTSGLGSIGLVLAFTTATECMHFCGE